MEGRAWEWGNELGVEGRFAPGQESANGAVGRWVGGWATLRELNLETTNSDTIC